MFLLLSKEVTLAILCIILLMFFLVYIGVLIVKITDYKDNYGKKKRRK